MSPEQIQGVTAPDARSGPVLGGVSLYELVTGKRPFDGDSQFAIMSAHLQGTPVPPVTIDPRLPQLLNDVILMLVAKDPNARFQTAARRCATRCPTCVAEAKTPAAVAVPLLLLPVGQPARSSAAGKPSRTMDGAWRGGCRACHRRRGSDCSLERSSAAPRRKSPPRAAQPVASEPPAPWPRSPPRSRNRKPQQPAAVAHCASGRHSRRCRQPSNRKPSRSGAYRW